MSEARKRLFGPGEAVPWFDAPVVDGSPRYAFNTAGGRAILLFFMGSAGNEACAAALAEVMERRDLFDDSRAAFFGFSVDPEDVARERIRQQLPGIRFFLDFDRRISRLYGASADDRSGRYTPHFLLLDRTLRVVQAFPLGEAEAAAEALAAEAGRDDRADWAPVVQVEHVFEPELCRRLIDLYEADGGEASGFMRDIDGKTRQVIDPSHKVRRDCLVGDPELVRNIHARIQTRLAPMIQRVFAFEATRIERLLVGCYEAKDGGHFNAHRDNTTKGTAHRRFAVTINLNADEYDGGDLNFPEYGRRTYRPPTGGAVVFSCGLLHRALPVTRGRRFAFLPFLYDEAAAKLREENARFTEGELANYRAGGR